MLDSERLTPCILDTTNTGNRIVAAYCECTFQRLCVGFACEHFDAVSSCCSGIVLLLRIDDPVHGLKKLGPGLPIVFDGDLGAYLLERCQWNQFAE